MRNRNSCFYLHSLNYFKYYNILCITALGLLFRDYPCDLTLQNRSWQVCQQGRKYPANWKSLNWMFLVPSTHKTDKWNITATAKRNKTWKQRLASLAVWIRHIKQIHHDTDLRVNVFAYASVTAILCTLLFQTKPASPSLIFSYTAVLSSIPYRKKKEKMDYIIRDFKNFFNESWKLKLQNRTSSTCGAPERINSPLVLKNRRTRNSN